ncbi:MAG: glycosyltransferase family 2 protein [bacterium]
MDLSIIITTLNNKKVLEECINSVKQFTRSIRYELVIVDNNSSDGTQSLVRSKYPNVALIENKKNLGFSTANNKGLALAKGRYSVLLNDDTYIKDDVFGKMVRFLDNEPGIGICGPKLLNIDSSIQRQGSIFSAHKWRSKSPIEVPFVLGACLFIRKAVMDKIGLLDENLFFYNEDLDLCKRARSAGFKVVYYPDAETYHYGGYSSKKAFDERFFIEGFRGGLYLCRKHYGPIVYSLYRASLLLFALLMVPFSLLHKEKLSAYLKILRMTANGQIVSKT